MLNKNACRPKDSSRSGLWSAFRAFPEPADFRQGWRAEPLALPDRLLVFSRESGRGLKRSVLKDKHHRFVLIVALDGAGEVCVDERVFRVAGGSLLLLFPFQFHHYLSFSRQAIRWGFVTFELEEPHRIEGLRNRIFSLEPPTAVLLGNLLGAVGRPARPSLADAAAARLQLALVLHELSRGGGVLPETGVVGHEAAGLLEKINRFLYQNIERPFVLEELARQVGYSESHLRTLFKRSLRMSLGKYISEIRLRKACGLLHQGELNISEIAGKCGYGSLFSFSRAFRQAMGCSPRDYRLQASGGISGSLPGDPKSSLKLKSGRKESGNRLP